MVEGVFIELSYIVMVTAVLAVVAKFFKQPLIIAYILAGVVVSPHVLDLVKSHDAIATFSQLGIAFLLFMVGLDLSPKVVKQVGKVSLITGAMAPFSSNGQTLSSTDLAIAAFSDTGRARRVEPVSTSCFSMTGIRSTSTREPLRNAIDRMRARKAAAWIFLPI